MVEGGEEKNEETKKGRDHLRPGLGLGLGRTRVSVKIKLCSHKALP
jgi:hypothetical protein